MKLFGRNVKAWEKWRAAARMIDLHKTKVIIIESAQAEEPTQDSPPWLNQMLRDALNAVPSDSCIRDPIVPDPEMPQRYFSQDKQTTLTQYFG